MSVQLDTNYMLDTLKKYLTTPSPSGFTYDIMEIVKNDAHQLGYSYEVTNKGCGVITIPGQTEDEVIGLSAHVDTLGAIVRSIKGNGYIRFSCIGGFMMESIEGEYCQIFTRDGKIIQGTILSTMPSVHAYSNARDNRRIECNMEIRLDAEVKNKEDVQKLGIEVGNFIAFNPRMQMLENGFIKSRHLDDKAGVSILMTLCKYLSDHSIVPSKTLKILISNYEEVGHGSSYIPNSIDEFIAIDMGVIGDDLTCTEHDVSICVKDSSGPYDYTMVNNLLQIAKNHKLSYALDVYPHYGSDASAALSGGNNIRAALIGPGVHSSHGLERTHVNGMKNTVELLYHYVTQ